MRIRRNITSVTAILALAMGFGAIVGVPSVANAAATTPITLAQAINRATLGPASTDCQHGIAIHSLANNKYVSAELAYTGGNLGMLRARASSVGPWELFTECYYSSGYYTLSSDENGLFVTAELGNTGSNYAMLRARATVVGPWEKFDINCFVSSCTIKSLANGLYVSAELGYTGNNYAMLRARAGTPGSWETFR